MAYFPLALPDELPETVCTVIRRGVEPMLEDIRWMLSTPTGRLGTSGLPRQLQVPVALMLLATLEGVAAKLFQPERKMNGRERFKECLKRYFPWDVDPPTGESQEKAGDILYDAFRNPLIHRLGLHDSKSPAAGIVLGFPGDGAESSLERLERSRGKPISEPCLVVTPHRRTLWLEPLYWGVRILVERWSCDTTQVARAERKFRKPLPDG